MDLESLICFKRNFKLTRINYEENLTHAFRYFFKLPSSTKLSKVYASTAISYFPPTPLFPFDTSPRLCRAEKNGNRIGEDKGENICRGTEPSSRRTWIYCIQTRRNRTRVRSEGERVTDDSGQRKGVGGGGVGRGRVRRLLYSRIIYHPL